ncbi:MAG TPA: ATPase, T2SS/T4P/T4SS family [Mariprofundaceae bacterium]|nr:ATPase, T2SS/T4P/T4SS family [Mariprofundaceae bacterium]
MIAPNIDEETAQGMEQLTDELKVSVTLFNQEVRQGYLINFDPKTYRLALRNDADEIKYFDVPKVIYLTFDNSMDSAAFPENEHLEEMLINTVTGEQFHVLMAPSRPHELGIFCFSKDDDPKKAYYYFYKHGIRTLEHPAPIGQILSMDNKISDNDVKRALDAQKTLKKKQLGDILVDTHGVDQKEVEKAVASQKRERKPIGEILIEAGMIKDDDLQQALEEQSKNRSLKIGQVLLKLGMVTEAEVASALAKKFNMKLVDLEDYIINPELIDQFDLNLLLRFQLLPISSTEDTLTVANADPMNFEAFDAIRFQSTKRIIEVLATPTQIQHILSQHIDAKVDTDHGEDWLIIERIDDDKDEGDDNEAVEIKAAEAQPIVRLVNKILSNAIHQGASDIHVLPQAKELLLFYRINGDLKQVMVLEKWVQRRMVSRIKLLSGMNITEHRLTQDGRMMIRTKEDIVEFRVSSIPNAHGESIVMRVLDKEVAVNLETLGVSQRDRTTLSRMIRKPFGLILATGPTGSGKSTTLFALMQSIIDLPIHILTIEDPVESEIKGANQIQVNTKIGFTFASILRNVLRHDPDVIMVGEMRDPETTSIAIEAALTGHMLLSTLHTNSAVDTVIRLHDLGIPNYLLAPALQGIISQNLLKRLCDQCKEPLENQDDEIYEILDGIGYDRPASLYVPGKCEQCNQTGFSGRIMAYEFLEVTDAVRQAIHDGKIGAELQNIAESEGMVPKAKHALSLAESGAICRDDLFKLLI